MQPYQERVIAEKAELDAKCERLRTFIAGAVFPTLDGSEQYRLNRQLNAMMEYSDILDLRITAFPATQLQR